MKGMTRRTPDLAAIAATVTVILWASAFIAIRSAGESFSPGALAFGRLATALVALVPIVVVMRRRNGLGRGLPPLPRGRGLVLVLVYGVAWFALYTVTLNWAEQHLDAGTAALLVNFAPILVAVFAGLFLGEGFSHRLLVGIGVAFAGVVLITAGGSGPHADWLGIALGVAAAVLYATGVLVQKVALSHIDALSATFWGVMAGVLATVPVAPAAVREVAAAPASDIAAMIFLGVGPTAIAFTTWAYALSRTSAGALAATSLVVPALVIVLSWLVLSEVPTPLRIAGGVLCLAGVAMTRGLIRLPRRRARASVVSVASRPVIQSMPVESELEKCEVKP
ncbi:multidrug transporter [Gordonia jacobaea]|uniref:Multidrug transporter n=2 Tax=Gordoniaceae TaxID=85026 RepID=A0ABR5I8J9_9ACTN|nr:multidrug transporter [Gordonia jacobaea]